MISIFDSFLFLFINLSFLLFYSYYFQFIAKKMFLLHTKLLKYISIILLLKKKNSKIQEKIATTEFLNSKHIHIKNYANNLFLRRLFFILSSGVASVQQP